MEDGLVIVVIAAIVGIAAIISAFAVGQVFSEAMSGEISPSSINPVWLVVALVIAVGGSSLYAILTK